MSKVLIIAPESGSYFYRLTFVNRLKEALQDVGWLADICTLATYEHQSDYHSALFVNIAEMVFHYDDPKHSVSIINQICEDIPKSCAILAENVQTPHFRVFMETCQLTNIQILIDIGFHTQQDKLPMSARTLDYYYVFNGLTDAEAQHIEAAIAEPNTNERAFNWAMVGAYSSSRVRVVQEFSEIDANGFTLLVTTVPIDTKGVHLDEQQLHNVLEKSQTYVWSTHHDYFYMESERFRQALLSGCVPVKVVFHPLPHNVDAPFKEWVVEIDNLSQERVQSIQNRLHDLYQIYLSYPRFGEATQKVLEALA